MSEQVDRNQVVSYLKFLAANATIENGDPKWLAENPAVTKASFNLLQAGLRAAAKQIDEGVLDCVDFTDDPEFKVDASKYR